eukprot:164057-Amphidinium_carterae.2
MLQRDHSHKTCANDSKLVVNQLICHCSRSGMLLRSRSSGLLSHAGTPQPTGGPEPQHKTALHQSMA